MGNVLQYIKIVVATQFMLYIMHFIYLNLLQKNLKQKIQYCLQGITLLCHDY